MKTKINLIELNKCGLNCNCGSNISLGFNSNDLDDFLIFISQKYEIKDIRGDKKIQWKHKKNKKPKSVKKKKSKDKTMFSEMDLGFHSI